MLIIRSDVISNGVVLLYPMGFSLKNPSHSRDFKAVELSENPGFVARVNLISDWLSPVLSDKKPEKESPV